MNKTGMFKTTIKSFITLLLFSLVLEINERNIYNYLIFVASWMIMTFIYEIIKYSTKIEITTNGISFTGLFKHSFVNFKTVKDAFLTKGILQARFKLSSVYLVQEKRTIPLRDLKDGPEVLNKIESSIGKKQTDFSSPQKE